MMQPRALAVGDGEIVHVALAMHPGGGDASIRTVFFCVFSQAEAETGVEIDCALHIGRKHVEVVEPLRMAALVKIVSGRNRCGRLSILV